MENRVNELDSKTVALDNEIKDLFVKVRNSRGSQQTMLKQKLMMLMKRRKMLDNQTKNYMNQQMALDNVAFTQENIQNTMEMAAAMKQGLSANMEAMKGINIDQLQDLKDDMQDMMWECNQINDALNYDLDDDVDEDELDAELAEFENELKIQGMLGPNANKGANANTAGMLNGLNN